MICKTNTLSGLVTNKKVDFELIMVYCYCWSCLVFYPGTQSQAKPELSDLFSILLPVASEWKSLGTLLKLRDSDLDTIKADNHNQSVDCLRETLSLLLQQTEPTCTWQAVAEAVKLLNPQKAKEISNQFLKQQ